MNKASELNARPMASIFLAHHRRCQPERLCGDRTHTRRRIRSGSACNGDDSAYSTTATAATTTIVPAAPTSPTATAASNVQINLSWVDNSDNEVNYKVERSTDGVNFTEIATVASMPGIARSPIRSPAWPPPPPITSGSARPTRAGIRRLPGRQCDHRRLPGDPERRHGDRHLGNVDSDHLAGRRERDRIQGRAARPTARIAGPKSPTWAPTSPRIPTAA